MVSGAPTGCARWPGASPRGGGPRDHLTPGGAHTTFGAQPAREGPGHRPFPRAYRWRCALRRRRRRDYQPLPEQDEFRVNERIRIPRVLLIDETGQKLGEMRTEEAMSLARERSLDLVEVAPNARPPVCKLADYGKMKYEKKKRDAAARRRQHHVTTKEIKLRPKTDDHDMGVKIRAAHKFLLEGNKVKITVRFRGREHAHREIGVAQCMKVAESVADVGAIEAQPDMEGRQMTMLLSPTRRPEKPASEPKATAPAKATEAQPAEGEAAKSAPAAEAPPARTEA